MPYIGLAKSPYGPLRTQEAVLKELTKRGFRVGFFKHHWAGDLPFGLIVAETDRGDVAIRWALGREFSLKIEEVDRETYDEFVEDTIEYTNADSG
ncbi:hypothetical protein CL1_0433 [Thermococcus cleftensis]|uniref:Uncharacterized protein n=1 Tax=Thermococcus cleftensis (strain DSM 27260 / KACC 17922 / CL1) TaxID=163003 RepID=I3ZSF8_THECF|nr:MULTISPECIES: hypothetical protein [Thermococcus]AFL94642.1 hypothetical protein CL1_0433 [Thermococcus cleftensis]NJE03464.1 hypothetical protein [Thermococcus sp. MV11]